MEMDVSISAPIKNSNSVISDTLQRGFSEGSVDRIEDGFGRKVPLFKDSVLPPSTPPTNSVEIDSNKQENVNILTRPNKTNELLKNSTIFQNADKMSEKIKFNNPTSSEEISKIAFEEALKPTENTEKIKHSIFSMEEDGEIASNPSVVNNYYSNLQKESFSDTD